MILAYYNKIAANPITCSAYPNNTGVTPTHTSNYGFYVSSPYLSADGSTYFSTQSSDPSGNLAEGAFGYIWKDGINYVEQNLVGFLGKNSITPQFTAKPSQATAQNLVQSQIDAGNPLIARTYLTGVGVGHYVVIVGYEWLGSTFEYLVNDPFGACPYNSGYNNTYGESEYEVAQPQVYTYGEMDLGNADGTRGLITVASTLPAVPGTPTGLSASATGIQSISASWNTVNGATSYTLDRSISSSGPYVQVYSGSTAQYLDSGLQFGTTYYYEVCASNSVGSSAFSSWVSATTLTGMPTGLSAPRRGCSRY